MKKFLLAPAVLLLTATALFSQARKPVIMVIPSDAYCTRAGYVSTYQDENGSTQTAPDYSKAFLNDENLRLAVSELSSIMAGRGFPLKDLEQTLKSMDNQQAEAAHDDKAGHGYRDRGKAHQPVAEYAGEAGLYQITESTQFHSCNTRPFRR